jgi:hypothetical protein
MITKKMKIGEFIIMITPAGKMGHKRKIRHKIFNQMRASHQ